MKFRYPLRLAILRLELPLLSIVVLRLRVLVTSRRLVVSKRLKTEGYTDFVGLLQADALLHGHGGEDRASKTKE